jgi:hypothetical protein
MGREELGAVKLNRLSSCWKAGVRDNTVSFDIIQHYSENGVLEGYEWRRCQTQIEATEEIWELQLIICLLVSVLLAAQTGKAHPVREAWLTYGSWLRQLFGAQLISSET